MLFFELYKIMVKKVTFAGFTGGLSTPGWTGFLFPDGGCALLRIKARKEIKDKERVFYLQTAQKRSACSTTKAQLLWTSFRRQIEPWEAFSYFTVKKRRIARRKSIHFHRYLQPIDHFHIRLGRVAGRGRWCGAVERRSRPCVLLFQLLLGTDRPVLPPANRATSYVILEAIKRACCTRKVGVQVTALF